MFSIRRHLSRKISWIGALAIAIPLGIFYLAARGKLSEAFNENLLTKALTVSSLTDQVNGKVLFDFSEAFLNYFDNDTPTTVFQIWNAQGETLFALRKHKNTLLPQPTSGTPDIPEYDNIHLSDRIHAEKVKLRIVPVDLPQAVKNTCARFAGNAAKRKLTCHLELDAKTELADPVFLDSILENLTVNITEHSPENTTLSIKGKSLDNTYIITFANAAPGLTQDDITNLFDSFWQKNPARSDNHHCGLGLSLSKAFANAMGWALTASLKNGNLTLELQTATPPRA